MISLRRFNPLLSYMNYFNNKILFLFQSNIVNVTFEGPKFDKRGRWLIPIHFVGRCIERVYAESSVP